MMRRAALQKVFFSMATLLLCASALAQTPTAPSAAAPSATSQGTAAGEEPSDAENIVALQRLIELDTQTLAELQQDRLDTQRQFETRGEQFSVYDKELADVRRRLEEARQAVPPTDGAAIEAEAARIEALWTAARREFDFVIQRRKLIEQQLITLPEKIGLEQQGLDRLLKGGVAESELAGFPLPSTQNAVPSSDLAISSPSDPSADNQDVQERIFDPLVTDARKAYLTAEQAQQSAEERVQLLDRALDLFRDDLNNTRELLAAEQEEAQADQTAYADLTVQLATLTESSAPASEVANSRAAVQELEQQLAQSRQIIRRHADRIELIGVQLNQIQDTYESAVQGLDEARSDVEESRQQLEFLQSPLAPHRIMRWLKSEGVLVLVIVGLMALFWTFSQVVARKVVMGLARRSHRGSELEREERAQTLKQIFQSVAAIGITTVGGLALLDQLGIDVTVLLGGAAVFGMAFAFGAQALVRDYFSGFIMLMENQYRVGNVVRIGEIAGTVEDVTLRMTVLRDLKGVAHFIPHGQITTVSNLTHGWSRAVFDIGVGYGENVDQVMDVLVRLALELRGDPKFSSFIMNDPEMLGVDEFGDSAVVIKFMLRTQPLQQWTVKRELLRRIKLEFDRLGIEIPFPHRTIFHRDWPGNLTVALRKSEASEDPASLVAGNGDT